MAGNSIYSPPFESSITFPVVPGIQRSAERFDVHGVMPPLMDLGFVALAATRNEATAGAGRDVLNFLNGVSRFVLNDEVANDPASYFAFGYHPFAHILRGADRQAAAGAGVDVGRGRPLTRLAVGYDVKHDRGDRFPVAAVGVTLDIAGHPEFRRHYTRLSGMTSLNGDTHTLRVAVGYQRHDGAPDPDMSSSFTFLLGIGRKLSQFPMPRPAAG